MSGRGSEMCGWGSEMCGRELSGMNNRDANEWARNGIWAEQ